ncbi:dTDP-glucose 4,6-dehydratase [Streptomyces sp. NPDC059009]|uniref:dTDP-glucose 4,6-dehydratase n=1 Tax=Streptomyces sp. NPDC059009 TaxID=3346694 RepID=UPI0036C8125C
MEKIIVTGGAGFIGSHFVKLLLASNDVAEVTVLDALTYAGHKENLDDALTSPKVNFVRGNILDEDLVDDLVQRHDAVVHFAAESHVDRSFFEAGAFLATNVVGTHTLLEAAKRHHIHKFVHVSTDEVYGPMACGSASERSPLRPTVPYAASKACSDLIALSAFATDGVPVCVTRSSNNYGPHQHPEKIIPLFVTSLLKGEQVTLHGTGQHIRNWLHVEDNCQGINLVLRRGIPGEVYNIGGGTDLTTRELTGRLLELCDADWDQVACIPDRKANDVRYAMDFTKIAEDLGYRPRVSLADGLAQTVQWHRDHLHLWAPAQRNPDAPLAEINVPASMER